MMRRVTGFIAIALLAGACVAAPSSPLGDAGMSLDLSPFEGIWVVEGEVEPSNMVEVEAITDRTLVLRPIETGEVFPSSYTVDIAWADGEYIAVGTIELGEGGQTGTWGIGRLVLLDGGSKMEAYPIRLETLNAAIEDGTLNGATDSGLDNAFMDLYRLDSQGDDLITFLLSTPGVFEEEAAFTLVRADSLVIMPHEPEQPYPWEMPDDERFPSTESFVESEPWGETGPWGEAGHAPAYPSETFGTPPDPSTDQGGVPITGDSGEPLSVQRLVLALIGVLVAGALAAFGLDRIRGRARARAARVDGGHEPIAPVAGDGFRDLGAERSALAAIGHLLWPALLIFAVALGPVLFLTVLLRGIALPEWVPGVGAGTQSTLHDLSPYLIVFSFGTMIGVAEIASSFPSFAWEALRTKWGTVLVLLNAIGTVIVYAIVIVYASNYDHPLLRAFGIALAFAIMIRTRFVIARRLASPSDANEGDATSEGILIDFGWPYRRFQALVRAQIEGELLMLRDYATARLLDTHPTLESLDRLALHTIEVSSQTPDRAEVLATDLARLTSEDLPDSLVRARIARFIASTGGPDHVRFVLEHSG